MPRSHQTALVRAISRWSLAALALNTILGSSVFGLPSLLAALLGDMSPLVVPLGGLAMAVILACYAECGSRFTGTGGTYLYARAAFGRLVRIQVGWFTLLVRVTAAAANANLFVIYLAEFWPRATQPLPRFVLLTALVAGFAVVNYRGVQSGSGLNSLVTVAKLVPLLVLCIGGAGYLVFTHRLVPPTNMPASTGWGSWLQAILLLFFAYGGAETALMVSGEARDPRRDAAFALFSALGTVIVIYTLAQWIVVTLLPGAAHSARPLADAVRVMLGNGGAALISIGALVSVFGYMASTMLTGPRALFALAEQGDFPEFFATVHRRFRTPWFSILVFAVSLWGLALAGSFAWNVTVSAVGRFFYYGLTCAAVPVLRRKQKGNALFRLPGGLFLPGLGVLICVTLLTRADFSQSLILSGTCAVALCNWVLVRQRPAPLIAAPDVAQDSGSDQQNLCGLSG